MYCFDQTDEILKRIIIKMLFTQIPEHKHIFLVDECYA